jgi:hypothetical protein
MATLHIPPIVSRTTKSVDWLFDADLEALDNASEAAYARRERIERSVDFMDVLEEMCEATKPQQEAFMKALARGNAQDLHLIHCLLDQAKETIVKRRLAGGE